MASIVDGWVLPSAQCHVLRLWYCTMVNVQAARAAAARPRQLAASTMWPWQSPFPGCLLATSSRLSWTRPAACQAHHSTDVPLNNNNNNINYNLCLSVNLICRKKQRQLQQNDHLRNILSVSQKRFALQNLGFCQTAHWHLTSYWQLKKMKQILDFFIERPTVFFKALGTTTSDLVNMVKSRSPASAKEYFAISKYNIP